MTIITVEIDKEKDLSAVKDLFGLLGLNYQEESKNNLIYTEELKKMLDQRYTDYLEGRVDLISEEDSQKRIRGLLAAAGK